MNDTIKVDFANQPSKIIKKGTRYYELLDLENNPNYIGIRANKELVSLDMRISNDDFIEFVDIQSVIGNKIYQAGVKFVLEVALKEAFGKEYEVIFNHSIRRGIHINIKGPKVFSENDTLKLKEQMAKIVEEQVPIQRLNIDKAEAIQFYNLIGAKEKAQNIHNVTNEIVTLYKLKNNINYFYVEMPHNTRNLKNFDLHYISNNEIVLLFPNRENYNEIAPYIHYEKVIKNYKNNKYWLKEQKATYLAQVNEMVSNFHIADLVKSTEMFFNINIEKIVEAIINRKAKFVMIAGPSSSGKTTTTKKISLTLQALGYKPFMISVDDYFKEREETPKDENGNYDFESLEAIDTNLLSTQLQDLIAGKTVKMPRFDFVQGIKIFDKEVKLPNNSIILMEGLHCLNDQLTPTIANDLKYKIYLSPFMPLNVDRHNYISSTDVRILRRIVRDKRTRNRDVDHTIGYLETLRKGEEKYIYPFINQADTILNTAMAYEIGVLKVYAEPLLYSIDGNSPYYEEARRLINFLKGFFPIPSEYVNDDSVLREFIGNSIFE